MRLYGRLILPWMGAPEFRERELCFHCHDHSSVVPLIEGKMLCPSALSLQPRDLKTTLMGASGVLLATIDRYLCERKRFQPNLGLYCLPHVHSPSTASSLCRTVHPSLPRWSSPGLVPASVQPGPGIFWHCHPYFPQVTTYAPPSSLAQVKRRR